MEIESAYAWKKGKNKSKRKSKSKSKRKSKSKSKRKSKRKSKSKSKSKSRRSKLHLLKRDRSKKIFKRGVTKDRKSYGSKQLKSKQGNSKQQPIRDKRQTGVKSVWRRDGLTKSSTQRWGNSRQHISDQAQRTKHQSTFSRQYSRRQRARLKLYYAPPPSRQSPYGTESPSRAVEEYSSGLIPSSNLATLPDNPIRDQKVNLGLVNLGLGSWIEGIELESSTTMWLFDAPLIQSNNDDWSRVNTETTYKITPTILYRGQLYIHSQWLDVSMSYESKSGVQFLGEKGSLLALALAVPDLIPVLAPLSFSYRRTRFAEGLVSLKESPIDVIEQQEFTMVMDRYEARWALSTDEFMDWYSGMSVFMGYDRRGIPRHIYLKEKVNVEENESYDLYSDISDQILWTVSNTWDLGFALDVHMSDRLLFNIETLLGFGTYELFTPLEGQRLDRGHLAGIGVKLGIEYAVPLTSWLTFKTSYLLSARTFEPIGLPNQLTRDFNAEGIVIDHLSLHFGTIDLLQRAWVSLVFNIATRPLEHPSIYLTQ